MPRVERLPDLRARFDGGLLGRGVPVDALDVWPEIALRVYQSGHDGFVRLRGPT